MFPQSQQSVESHFLGIPRPELFVVFPASGAALRRSQSCTAERLECQTIVTTLELSSQGLACCRAASKTEECQVECSRWRAEKGS